MRTGLSYGDVLLVPQRSPVESRGDVDLTTHLTDEITLDLPVLSAPMDTVTESETAIALSAVGGLGVVHRFVTVAEQADEVRAVAAAGERVGAAVGIDEDALERTAAVLDAGADCVVVDVAHGHMEKCLTVTERIRDAHPDVDLVVGNVATPAAVEDLAAAGADTVKVGVGPGSVCTTRKVAGAGVPQFTAVRDCAEAARDVGVRVIADGGIGSSGDAAKALLAGADTVMMGSFFAGTNESPGSVVTRSGQRYKRSRGMASTGASRDRTDKADAAPEAEEGIEALTPYRGPLAEATREFVAGIRSGLSYCGGADIETARANAEFIRVAPAAKEREGAHSVVEFDDDSL